MPMDPGIAAERAVVEAEHLDTPDFEGRQAQWHYYELHRAVEGGCTWVALPAADKVGYSAVRTVMVVRTRTLVHQGIHKLPAPMLQKADHVGSNAHRPNSKHLKDQLLQQPSCHRF